MHSAGKHSISACDELGLVRLTMAIENVEGVNGHDAWISARAWVFQSKCYQLEEPDESIPIAIGLVWLMADGLVYG